MSELMVDVNAYDNEWVDDGYKCLRQWVSWWWMQMFTTMSELMMDINVYDNEWVDGYKCLWQWMSWWWI